MQAAYYFILIPMVYAAGAVFLIGTLFQGVRILLGLRYSLKAAVGPERKPRIAGALYEAFLLPETLKGYPAYWVAVVVFHVALLLTLVGHIDLVGEIDVLQAIGHELLLGGGIVDLALLVTLLFFLFRRFHSPVRDISFPTDYYLLILLLLVVLFGSQLHLARRLFDYSTISIDEYREYLWGLVAFRPVLPDVFTDEFVGHSFLLVLHVFFANLFLMVFPSSKMMHSLLALPLARLSRR